MKVGIINNSLGNVGSVLSAFGFYKFDVDLVNSEEEISGVDVIVLAGVGNFITAASKLKEMNFWDRLNEAVLIKKKPVLGICLGMHLFADVGYEDGVNKGFGWINGEVRKIDESLVRVPHIGWDEVKPRNGELFEGARYRYYYFMHSYQFIPKEEKDILATTDYGEVEIVSAIRRNNIFGVQFHPEKSQGDGLRLIRNFLEVVQ